MKTKRSTGFTLIEVLVVVAIIALLVGILMPSLSKARTQARRTVCTTNLHQVGNAMNAYLSGNRDHMPYVSYMPSISDRAPLIDDPSKPSPQDPVYFAVTLQPQLTNTRVQPSPHPVNPMLKVLSCPDDTPGKTERIDRNGAPYTQSYFETEWSSYDYRYRLGGAPVTELGDYVGRNFQNQFATMYGGTPNQNTFQFWRRRSENTVRSKMNPASVWFSRDYDNFHANGVKVDPDNPIPGIRRYAYIDGHVSDYEN